MAEQLLYGLHVHPGFQSEGNFTVKNNLRACYLQNMRQLPCTEQAQIQRFAASFLRFSRKRKKL